MRRRLTIRNEILVQLVLLIALMKKFFVLRIKLSKNVLKKFSSHENIKFLWISQISGA